MPFKNSKVGNFLDPVAVNSQKSSVNIDVNERPSSISLESQERPSSLSVESQERPSSLSVESQDRGSSISLESQDRSSSLSVESQDRSSSLNIEAQDRASSLSVESQDRASSLSVETQDRPSSLSIEQQDRSSSLSIENQDRNSSLSIESQDRASSLNIENQDRPASLNIESQDRSSSLSIEQQDRSSSLNIENQDRSSSLNIENQDRPSSLSIEQQDRSSSLSVETQDRPSSLSVESQDRSSSLVIENQDRPSSINVESQDRSSSLSVETQDRPSSLSVESQDRSSSLSVENQDRQSSLSVESQERQSSLSIESQERSSSLSVESQERSSSLGVENQERSSSLSIQAGIPSSIPVLNTSYVGSNTVNTGETPLISSILNGSNSIVTNELHPSPVIKSENATSSSGSGTTYSWDAVTMLVSISKSSANSSSYADKMYDVNGENLSKGNELVQQESYGVYGNLSYRSYFNKIAPFYYDTELYDFLPSNPTESTQYTSLRNDVAATTRVSYGKANRLCSRYFNVYGRWLDSYNEVVSKKHTPVESKFPFGLGSSFSVTFNISNTDPIYIPCFPVYGSVSLNVAGHVDSRADYYESRTFNHPLPSLVFPVLSIETTSSSLFSNATRRCKFKNPSIRNKEYSDAFVTAELNQIVTKNASGKPLFPSNTDLDSSYTSVQSHQVGVLYNKDMINNETNNCVINPTITSEPTDGLFLGGRLYRDLNTITIPANASKRDVEIFYTASHIYTGQENNASGKDEPFFMGGNKVYSIVPYKVVVGGVTYLPSTANVLYMDETRYLGISTDKTLATSTSYTVNSRRLLWEDNTGKQLYIYRITITGTAMYVFGYKHSTNGVIYTSNYIDPSMNTSSAVVIDIKEVRCLVSSESESVFTIDYNCGSGDKTATVSAIKLSKFGLSTISKSGLSNSFLVEVDPDIDSSSDTQMFLPNDLGVCANSSKIISCGPVSDADTVFTTNFPYFTEFIASNESHSYFRGQAGRQSMLNHAYLEEYYTGLSKPTARESLMSFVDANIAHAYIDSVGVKNDVGRVYFKYLNKYRSQAHGEIIDSFPYYEDATVLPIIVPVVMPMKNSSEVTLITYGRNTIHGMSDENFLKSRFSVSLDDLNDDSGRAHWNLLSRDLRTNSFTLTGLNTATLSVPNTSVRWNGIACGSGNKHLRGFTGSVIAYKSKKVGLGGVWETIDTAKQILGASLSQSSIVRANNSSEIGDKRYLIKGSSFYGELNKYVFSSVTDKISPLYTSYTGLNVNAFKIGSYNFFDYDTYYEISYTTDKEVIPIYGGAGKLVKVPCVVGQTVYFAVVHNNEILIYNLKQSVIQLRYRQSATGTNNVNMYWNTKYGSCFVIYGTSNKVCAISVSDTCVNLISPLSYSTSFSVSRNYGISGIFPPTILIDGVAKDLVQDTNSAFEIVSSDIIIPSNSGRDFVITGVEAYGTTKGTISATLILYNSYDNSTITTSSSYSTSSGKIEWQVTTPVSVSSIRYKLSLTNFILRDIRLTGYMINSN